MERFFEKLLTGSAVVFMVLLLAACASEKDSSVPADNSKPFIDVTDDGSVICNLEKTEKGTGGGSGITIEEGEYLVVDTELTEGKVHVRVVSGGSDINTVPVEEDTPATIDYVYEESGTTEYREIKAGDYMINIMVEETANGKITFSKASEN